jgi:hypothetical protein
VAAAFGRCTKSDASPDVAKTNWLMTMLQGALKWRRAKPICRITHTTDADTNPRNRRYIEKKQIG